MQEELRENPNAYFMTLTIDDKNYKELKKAAEDKTDNGIATIAMRRMLERIRKKQEKAFGDRKSTRLNSSHRSLSRMPSSA